MSRLNDLVITSYSIHYTKLYDFQGAIKKAGLDTALIDEVIAGQAKQSTDAPNIARVSALMSAIPEAVPAYSVHRQCASGMP